MSTTFDTAAGPRVEVGLGSASNELGSASAVGRPGSSDSGTENSAAPVAGPSSLLRPTLITLAVLLLAGVLELTVGGRLTHESAQNRLYNHLRNELALGTAPVSEVDDHDRAIADGTPLAVLTIPSIGVREVVVEGTSSGVLIGGPGHLRDTPLPGEAGTCQIFGRVAAYGGPFGGLHRLRRGQVITFTMAAGVSKYRVIDVRRPGDLIPSALGTGAGRVTLVTADGLPFVPSGVLRVDADLIGQSSAPTSARATLSSAERAMGFESGSLWELVQWLEALLVLIGLGALSWNRWGKAQTWIVFLPPLLLVGFFVTNEVARLLPNLT